MPSLPALHVCPSQVLGGQLADKYGGKRVLAAGVTLWSLFTFLTPEAAALGAAPLLAARVLLGVGEGVAFPAIHSMIARNVPPVGVACRCWTVTTAVLAQSYLGMSSSTRDNEQVSRNTLCCSHCSPTESPF